MNNVTNKSRKCVLCLTSYMPSSNRQLYCISCTKIKNNEWCTAYHKRTYVRKGYNQKGKNNNFYKKVEGRRAEWKYAKYRKNYCEHCSSDGAGSRLVVHHKDENPTNNILVNLITLCDSCHKYVHRGKIVLAKV